MIPKLNEVLILIGVFGIIYWFQSVEDKKNNKVREGVYQNIKLPLLVSSIVGLVMFWNVLPIKQTSTISQNVISIPQNTISIPQIGGSIENFGNSNLDVYTGLADW
jgi:hypothetical protein